MFFRKMKMRGVGILMLFFVIVFTSCSTALKSTSDIVKPMEATRVLRKVNRESPKYKTYEIDRASISLKNGDVKNSFTGQILVQKDEEALITVRKMNMPLARGYMSNDSLKLVNFIERNYIVDDVRILKQLLGFNLEFSVLQALLTADAASFISANGFEKEMVSTIDSFMYRIDSDYNSGEIVTEKQLNSRQRVQSRNSFEANHSVNYSAWIDPQLFVVRKLLINDIQNQQEIIILYDNYKKVGRSLFPQTANVTVDTAFGPILLNLKLSRQSVNKTKGIEFNIPTKYEELILPRN